MTTAESFSPPRRRRRRTPGSRRVEFDPPDTSTARAVAGGMVKEIVPSSAWFGPSVGGSQERELMAFLGSHSGVAVLQWPRDAEHLELLTRVGIPRLLLVHPSPHVPPADGPLQMALGHSASQADIHRRLLLLCRQAAHRRSVARCPRMDEENRLHAGNGSVELPPIAQRLARVLVARFGRPVEDDHLLAPEVVGLSMSAAALEGQLARLCQLVNPIGLEVVPASGHSHTMRWCAG